MAHHVVYVLESQKDKGLYIGVTRNLTTRLRRHNTGFVRSTKARRPFDVLGYRQFDSVDGAWLSLVERLVRDQEVLGSNPSAPISFSAVDVTPKKMYLYCRYIT